MKHVEFEKLVNNAEIGNAFSLGDEREVCEHLRLCATCAAKRAKLENFFAYARRAVDTSGEQVSQATTAQLLNVFQPKQKAAARARNSFAKRFLADLIFDDWQTAPNERFSATDSRHLLYRAGEFEIDLRLNFGGGKCQLSGQIFPDCGAWATIEIFSAAMSQKVFCNNYCEFVFAPIAEGVYTLRLNLDGAEIEIENFSLIN